MSLVAMSIDAMLPALGTVAEDLGARAPNDRQLVLTLFFGGLTAGQLVYGPVSDAIGRRTTTFIALAILAAGTLLCRFATTFPMMLAGRLIAGIGAAGPRIVSVAIVRDLQDGRAMARTMSLVMAVFILVPIVAPAVGQAVLAFSTWRTIFTVLLVMTSVVFVWFALRQSETLPRERRTRLSVAVTGRAMLETLRSRAALGFGLASGLIFGALVAFLATAQQIFDEVYGLGAMFPLYFAILAGGLGAASLVNARLVGRFGMHLLSSRALRVSVVLSGIFFVVALGTGGHPPLWAFMAYMFVVFFCNGLLFGNFNALALEPLGHIAGTAAAFVGSLATFVSVVIGTPIGRAYDGTVTPLVAGLFFLTLGALVLTWWTTRAAPVDPPMVSEVTSAS